MYTIQCGSVFSVLMVMYVRASALSMLYQNNNTNTIKILIHYKNIVQLEFVNLSF